VPEIQAQNERHIRFRFLYTHAHKPLELNYFISCSAKFLSSRNRSFVISWIRNVSFRLTPLSGCWAERGKFKKKQNDRNGYIFVKGESANSCIHEHLQNEDLQTGVFLFVKSKQVEHVLCCEIYSFWRKSKQYRFHFEIMNWRASWFWRDVPTHVSTTLPAGVIASPSFLTGPTKWFGFPHWIIENHPSLHGVRRRFETARLYPRFHPRDIISRGPLPSHALPPAIYY
jgi:hypothetical protein